MIKSGVPTVETELDDEGEREREREIGPLRLVSWGPKCVTYGIISPREHLEYHGMKRPGWCAGD